MKGAKELAGILRHMRDHLSLDDIQKGILRESAAHLDAKAAIDSAMPGEVKRIQRLHDSELTRLGIAAGAAGACQNADRDRAALLAVVHRQAGEIAELRAHPAMSMDARISADLAAARAEIEHLKAQLVEHADHPHLYICPQVAKSAADMGKERDALKAANTALATENARLVNEHAAAMSRAHSGAVVVPVLPTNEDDDRLMNEILGRVHEQRTGRVLLDLTPGGPVKTAPPVGQAGGEPWRKGLPDVRLRRAWEFWECKLDGRWTSRLLEDRDLQLSKAGDYWRPLNKTWSEVEQMARDADGGEEGVVRLVQNSDDIEIDTDDS